jgi:hypothetical protein
MLLLELVGEAMVQFLFEGLLNGIYLLLKWIYQL